MDSQKPKFSCAGPIGHNKGVNRVRCAMPFEGRQEGKLDEWWGRAGRILPPKMEVSLIDDIGPDRVALEIRNHNEG